MLETNGIKLGEDEKYVAELSQRSNLHVRPITTIMSCNQYSISPNYP